MVWRVAVLTALALAFPAAARAADLSVTGGILRYTASPGHVSNVTFVEGTTEGPVQVFVTRATATDDDPLLVGAGCTGDADSATCSGPASVVIDAGDQSDRITAGA